MKRTFSTILYSAIVALVMIAQVVGQAVAQGEVDTSVITLESLGRTEILLDGPYDSDTLSFGLPAHWQPTDGAEIYLNFTVSFNTVLSDSQVVSYGGSLAIYFNKNLISVLPLETIGTQEHTFPVPIEYMISQRSDGRMEFRFELNSGISCIANQHMNVVLNGVSRVFLPHENILPNVDLANFPYPIYVTSLFPDTALIVIPDQPTVTELRSAMTVAAGFGNLTNSNLVLDLTTISHLTPEVVSNNHIIFVGKIDSLPNLTELPLQIHNDEFLLTSSSPDDGFIELINSPWSIEKVVLVVSGNTDEGVLKAAQAISTGKLRPASSTNLAIVETVRDIPTSPPLLSELIFSDLGYEQELLSNRGIDSVFYGFYIPPGYTVSPDSYLELAFGHSALLDFDQSGLVVLLNDQPIGSVRFTDDTVEQAVNRQQISIPPSVVLPGNNTLEIRSSLEPLNTCTDPNLEGIWATIWPESRFHLPLSPAQTTKPPVETLNAYPAPFVYDYTLSNTAFVLPEADLEIWKDAMRVATFIGDRSNGPVSMLNVFFYGQISDVNLDQYHLIIVGQPSKISFFNELNDSLPIPFEQDSDIVMDDFSRVTYRTSPDMPVGYVELMPSPWSGDKTLFAVLGNSIGGITWAASALVDSPLRGQLAGNFAIVDEIRVQTIDTRLEEPGATDVVVDDIVSQPEAPEVVGTQTSSDYQPVYSTRPAWVLPAIQIVALLIVFILVFMYFRIRRKAKK